MLQALSVTGAMTFQLVYPLIMGINIGTCIVTAFLCSLGTSRDAKRTGMAHILFNVIGTILFMIVIGILESTGVITELMSHTVDSGSIANFQSFFNTVSYTHLDVYKRQVLMCFAAQRPKAAEPPALFMSETIAPRMTRKMRMPTL